MNQILPEFAIFYHFGHIYIEKSYMFSEFLIISSLEYIYFDYLMISYWFDINILSKIKLHMSQNVVLSVQNIKKMVKNAISAQ